jgi:hypothetical protein
LFQIVEDLKVIVRGIKFCVEGAPHSFFESDIDFSQLLGRQPQGDDVPDSHHDGIGNDLDSFRGEIFDETGFDEVVVDFIQRFALVMTQDDGQHDLPVVGSLLGLEHTRDEKKPAEQDPFHGLCLAWVEQKPSSKEGEGCETKNRARPTKHEHEDEDEGENPLRFCVSVASEDLGLVAGVIGHELFTKLSEGSGFVGGSNLFRQIEIEMEVMDRDEPETKDFFGFHQVTNVGPGKRPAG